MAPDEFRNATLMAEATFLIAASARVLMALRSGETRAARLLIEAGLGGILGWIAAGAVCWFDPSLRDIGWPLLIVSGAAGCAGAVGTQLLDIVTETVRKRAGL